MDAAKVLFSINKRSYLNAFNLRYLSMPLEHSLQQNYWCYQSIKMYLTEQAKAKTRSDIGAIASMNDINVGSLAQSLRYWNGIHSAEQYGGQGLINITQGSAQGHASMGGKSPPSRK